MPMNGSIWENLERPIGGRIGAAAWPAPAVSGVFVTFAHLINRDELRLGSGNFPRNRLSSSVAGVGERMLEAGFMPRNHLATLGGNQARQGDHPA